MIGGMSRKKLTKGWEDILTIWTSVRLSESVDYSRQKRRLRTWGKDRPKAATQGHIGKVTEFKGKFRYVCFMSHQANNPL